MLQKIFGTDEKNVGATVLRATTGSIFFMHGAQKLFGWFGGYGLQGTAQFMSSLGLNPGIFHAGLAGSAEFFGGLLLIVGLLTRPSAAALAVIMLVAAFTVHLKNGFFLDKGGFEYVFALFGASAALLLMGAGSLSLDKLLSHRFGNYS